MSPTNKLQGAISIIFVLEYSLFPFAWVELDFTSYENKTSKQQSKQKNKSIHFHIYRIVTEQKTLE